MVGTAAVGVVGAAVAGDVVDTAVRPDDTAAVIWLIGTAEVIEEVSTTMGEVAGAALGRADRHGGGVRVDRYGRSMDSVRR